MAKRSLKKKVYQFTAVFEKNEDGGYTVTVPS
jgi:predicted RNase H-like HicB family nuclease